MTHHELIHFVTGWRGFLVGARRHWHAHQRLSLHGHRGGYLLAQVDYQRRALLGALYLLTDLFQRGSTVWTYGCGPSRDYLWGVNHRGWRPGVLSNHLYLRIRHQSFNQVLTRVLAGRRNFRSIQNRRRRRPLRLSVRWGRRHRRRLLPLSPRRRWVFYGVTRAITPAEVLPPQTGWLARVAPSRKIVRPPRLSRWSHRRGRRVFLAGLFSRNVQRRHHLADAPAPAKSPAHSVRLKTRHSSWPVSFPAATLGGGFTFLGSTLLNEVQQIGGPFIYLHGSDALPSTSWSTHPVVWNQHSSALVGFTHLLTRIHLRAHRYGWLRVMWRRLAEW